MKWNNLKGIKIEYLLGILFSIPIILFAFVYFLQSGIYSSDFEVLGKRFLIVTLILFAIYGIAIYFSGFRFKQIGFSLKNVALGLLCSGILYLIFHFILFILASDRIQNNANSRIYFILPSLPLNIFGVAIFLSVIWEEFIYRAFLLPQYQIYFRKIGYRKSIALSIIITQVIFALHHLGNRIFLQNMDFQHIIIDQISLIITGAVLCLIYILSENLTYTIMVHLFMDFPVLFLSGINIPVQYLT